MESEKLKNINTDNLIIEEKNLIDCALKTKNLKTRYEYFQKARVLHNIAKECQKWETFTRGY